MSWKEYANIIIPALKGRTPLVIGATAAGKTSFSLELASALDAEIISVDSRQIYRGFRIGTAQPSGKELARVKHHLIDTMDPEEIVSAGYYVEKVEELLKQFAESGKKAVICGGSLLYIRALISGIIHEEDTFESIRDLVRKQIEKEGLEEIHERLRLIDPEYAGIIHLNDHKRITRAWEIYTLTGMAPSKVFEMQKNADKGKRKGFFLIGIFHDRRKLYHRIEERVDQMFENGWMEEVSDLLSAGVKPDCHAMQGVGYKQILDVLKGELIVSQAKEIIKQKSRQFARRQLTWLNKMDFDFKIDFRTELEFVDELDRR